MGQLGIIQDIKCRLGRHVMSTFNHYNSDTGALYYTDICINCHHGIWRSFVRYLTEEEKGLPIWEILETTRELYYGDDRDALMPYLELPT